MSARKSDKPDAPQVNSRRAPCPTCQDPSDADYAPFCSKRCADVDLHRWLSGGYAIPAEEDDGYGAEDSGNDRASEQRPN